MKILLIAGTRSILCEGRFRLLKPLPTDGELRIFVSCRQELAPDWCLAESRLALDEMLRAAGANRNPVVKRLPLLHLQQQTLNTETPSLTTTDGEVHIKFVVRLINAD